MSNETSEDEASAVAAAVAAAAAADEEEEAAAAAAVAVATAAAADTDSGVVASIDKDRMLAEYQEITHVEDIEQCQAILESTGWNLDMAVQSFFSGVGGGNGGDDDDDDIMQHQQHHHDDMIEGIDVDVPGSVGVNTFPPMSAMSTASSSSSAAAAAAATLANMRTLSQDLIDSFSNTIMPSASNRFASHHHFFSGDGGGAPSRRLIRFHMEYLGSKFELHVTDDECVRKLKELVEEHVNVPRKHLRLIGWKRKDMLVMDGTLLRDLNLSSEQRLTVVNTSTSDATTTASGDTTVPTTLAATSASSSSSSSSRDETFEIKIKLVDTRRQVTVINQSSTLSEAVTNDWFQQGQTSSSASLYTLNFDGVIRFIDLRRRIAMLTKVLVGDQEWWYYSGESHATAGAVSDEELATIKAANSLSSFHKLVEEGKLFSMPLTVLFEDAMSLSDMRRSLITLTSSNKPSPSALTAASDTTQATTQEANNSKLTPTPAATTTAAAAAAASPNALGNKLVFIITIKKHGVTLSSAVADDDPLQAFQQQQQQQQHQQQHANETSALTSKSKKARMNRSSAGGAGSENGSGGARAATKHGDADADDAASSHINIDNDTDDNNDIDDDDDGDDDNNNNNNNDDEDEDAMDDQFMAGDSHDVALTGVKQRPLIAQECAIGDELAATHSFNEEVSFIKKLTKYRNL